MKWRTCVKNVSQMEKNRAFSPLSHEEVATWAPWRQRSLQVIRRSPFGRHLVAMATECLQKDQVGCHLGSPWRPRGCKWRPLHKMVMVATCQIARKMVFVATFSSNLFMLQGRHSDQIATKAPPQRIEQLSVLVQECI